MLELQGVGKLVGRDVHIRDIDLVLKPGTINVLLGATLAGKTSLMRLMAGLDAPTAGRIRMNGVDVTGVPVRRRNVAMVYQQFINYPAMTVYENIASPLRVAGRPEGEVEAAVTKAAQLLKLTPYLQRTPLTLSGGQQQRTAIARALVKGADLVLLDEPLANLDYKLREELREELPRIFAASGAIFVYATTEPTEALLLGGNAATMSEGRVTQFGPTIEVYRQPLNLETARIFSDPPINVFDVIAQTGQVRGSQNIVFPPDAFRSMSEGAHRLGVRAHHLELGSSDGAQIEAHVIATEVTGSQTFIHAEAAGNRLVALLQGIRRVTPGDPIRLGFDPARALIFDADGRAAGNTFREAA